MIFDNPVRGTIAPTSAGTGFRMTQDFGPATNEWEPKVVWAGGEGIPAATYQHFHRGIDLGNKRCGADVLAAGPGIVSVSYRTSAGEHVIVIDHGSGWRSSYGHLASRTVAKGAKVTKGQKIGTLGSTGNSTACHLHFAVKSDVSAGQSYYLNSVGKMLDPWRRLRQNVTVHPIAEDGVNIRLTAGSGSTPGPKFAVTMPTGHIERLSDGLDLGLTTTARKWLGTVSGATYSIAGVPGTQWESFELDGAPRFVAAPLAVLSQK